MKRGDTPAWIAALQLGSIALMWAFVLGISVWIFNLLWLSHRLQDVPSASVAISVVAIPVFFAGAGVLTYVFFGLRHGADDRRPPSGAGGGGRAEAAR